MKKLFLAFAAIFGLIACSVDANSQSTIVVSSCGTLPNQNIPGSVGPIAVDTSGNLCTVLVQTITGTFTQGDIITTNSSGQMIDSTKYGSVNGGISINSSSVPLYANCFWNDTNSCVTVNLRMRERVFVGNAVLMSDNQTNASAATYLPDSTTGANWIPRDAQLLVMSDNGSLAIAGISQVATAPAGHSTIGVTGYALNNAATTGAAWGMYSEVQHKPGTASGSASYGIEVNCKNATATTNTADPYGLGSGCYGLWIAAGGGASYGGATNPSNGAIMIVANANKWSEGIVFQDGSLVKDGSNNSVAMSMGAGAQIAWYGAGGQKNFTIRSTSTTASTGGTIQWQDNRLDLLDSAGSDIFSVIRATGTTANHIRLISAVAGSPPIVSAAGSEAIVGMDIFTKSTGVIRVYPGADVAAAFTIQNAAKNKTYIAVDTVGNNVSLPQVTTGTPAASLCVDASNNIIVKTTTGACI